MRRRRYITSPVPKFPGLRSDRKLSNQLKASLRLILNSLSVPCSRRSSQALSPRSEGKPGRYWDQSLGKIVLLDQFERKSQTISVISGGMHWKDANPDNCCYHKHCSEKTLSDFAFCFPLIIFHNLADKGRLLFLSTRKTKGLLSHIPRMFVNCRVRMLSRVPFGYPRLCEVRWRAQGFASLLGAHRAFVPRAGGSCGTLRCEPAQRRAASS
jgi:hypothetical protein